MKKKLQCVGISALAFAIMATTTTVPVKAADLVLIEGNTLTESEIELMTAGSDSIGYLNKEKSVRYAVWEDDGLMLIIGDGDVTEALSNQYSNIANVKNVLIYGSITSFGDNAFNGCVNLKSVSISSSSYDDEDEGEGTVKSLGKNAFKDCSSLTDLHIGNSISTVGPGAFNGCSSLKKLTFDGINSISDDLFNGCSSLTTLEISSIGDKAIGNRAFKDCSSLKEFELDLENITIIGDEAFSNCTSIEELGIPDSVSEIGDKAFYNCNAISEINMEKLVSIGDYAFANCTNINEIESFSLEKLGAGAFSGCKNLENVVLNDGLLEIGANCFENTKLTTITVPETVTTLGANAFDKNVLVKSKSQYVVDFCKDNGYHYGNATVAISKIPELYVGEEYQIVYKVSADTQYGTACTFSSSDETIATVNSSGIITAKKIGTATITATVASGKSASVNITIGAACTDVSLDNSKVSLDVNKSITLKGTITPSSASQTLTWQSSDEAVATVSSSGKVTAKKAGTATITATAANGKKATCKVTVYDGVNAIKITGSKTELTTGDTLQLTSAVSPSTANASVTWSSNDTSIATVSDSGKVAAKKAGTVTITAKATNGKYTTYKIYIYDPVSSVSIKGSAKEMYVGKNLSLSATINPSTSKKDITWSSSNASIATVSDSGKVTAKKAGTVTITAKCGGKSDTYKINVYSVATSITLNKTKATIEVGSTTTLKATINPTGSDGKVTWSTSSSSVAAVSSNGKVTAKKAGTVTITAKTSNGKKATCKVTVEKK